MTIVLWLIPLVALLALAGYVASRWCFPQSEWDDSVSGDDLQRTRTIVSELELRAQQLRDDLERHHASVLLFRDRVAELGDASGDGEYRKVCLAARPLRV